MSIKTSISVDAAKAAKRLSQADNILILTHQYPDGDTLGSGFGLCHALRNMGKSAQVLCSDEIPERYDYMRENLEDMQFEPEFICSVDVADTALLGDLDIYADKIDLSIDHHPSNTRYAKELLLEDEYGAASMILYEVIKEMDTKITPIIAACLYTGISTDTGCFRYSNTTSYTMRIAADLMDYGAPSAKINEIMFDTKTRQRIAVEQMALSSIKYYFDNRCAVMILSLDMIKKSNANDGDLDGLSALPRQIEGVWVGVTFREKQDGTYKVSLRSDSNVNASAVCSKMNGGGHKRAAGCTVDGPFERALDTVLNALAPVMDK